MSSKKPTSLSSDLIVKKGEATPSALETNQNKKNIASWQEGEKIHKKQGTIAVTVRLDPDRYEKLKLYGLYNQLTNQELIVKSLDSFLSNQSE